MVVGPAGRGCRIDPVAGCLGVLRLAGAPVPAACRRVLAAKPAQQAAPNRGSGKPEHSGRASATPSGNRRFQGLDAADGDRSGRLEEGVVSTPSQVALECSSLLEPRSRRLAAGIWPLNRRSKLRRIGAPASRSTPGELVRHPLETGDSGGRRCFRSARASAGSLDRAACGAPGRGHLPAGRQRSQRADAADRGRRAGCKPAPLMEAAECDDTLPRSAAPALRG